MRHLAKYIRHFFCGNEPLQDTEILGDVVEPFFTQGYCNENAVMKTIVNKWKEEYTESNEACEFYYLVKALIKSQDFLERENMESLFNCALDDLNKEKDPCEINKK